MQFKFNQLKKKQKQTDELIKVQK